MDVSEFWHWWWLSTIIVAVISATLAVTSSIDFAYNKSKHTARKTLLYLAAFFTAPVLWIFPAIFYMYCVLTALYNLFRELIVNALDGSM